MKPPAKQSPAPVGSITVSSGNAGRAKNPSGLIIAAPYCPCLATTSPGPHSPPPERGVTRGAEVVPHRAQDVDGVEGRARQREVHGRAAEHPLPPAERGGDGIEGDRSHNCHGHEVAEATERFT